MISEYLGFDSDYIILGLAAFCVILFILTVVNMAKTSKLRKKLSLIHISEPTRRS